MIDEKDQEQPEHAVQQVSLVSSSPSARSIVRVVVIVLLLLAVKDFLGLVITSLTYLFFIIILAVFFAYAINPLVELIRKPFSFGKLAVLMPRPLAIAIAFLLVFSAFGLGVYLFAPRVTEQAKRFVTNIPTYTTALQSSINDFNRRLDRIRVSDAVQASASLFSLGSFSAAKMFVLSVCSSVCL